MSHLGDNLFIQLGAFAGAITALWGFAKWGVPLLKRGYREVFGIERSEACLSRIDNRLSVMEAELKPNDGHSLRDAINRIEGRVITNEHLQLANLQATKDGVFITDTTGKCVWVNRAYCMLTGKTVQELLGRGWINVFPEDIRSDILEDWNEHVEMDIEFDKHVAFNRHDKENIGVHIRSYKMGDAKLYGYLGIITRCEDWE